MSDKTTTVKLVCEGYFVLGEVPSDGNDCCMVQCLSCGWYSYGEGFHPNGNGEQIPSYCSHCGRKVEGIVEDD